MIRKGELNIETGLGLPRHTTTSRLAYTPTASGIVVFDTTDGNTYVWNGSTWNSLTGSNITSHDALSGLDGDDHPQYINNARGDSRYATITHAHATSDITSGVFSDARISESNVTQHESALSISTSQIGDFGDYVDLTSAQDINGIKTFKSNTIMDSSLVVNAGINSTSSEILAYKTIDVSGNLILSNSSTDTTIDLNAVSGSNPIITSSINSTTTGQLAMYSAYAELRHNDTVTTGEYTWVRLNNDDITVNAPITLSSAPVDDLHAATKKYVDDNAGGITDHGNLNGLSDDDHPHYLNETRGDARYVDLTTNQYILGNKTFTDATTTDSTLYIDGTLSTHWGDQIITSRGMYILGGTNIMSGSGDGELILGMSSTGLNYKIAFEDKLHATWAEITANVDEFEISHTKNVGTGETTLILNDDTIEANVPVHVVDSTDSASAVTRGYIDGLNLTGSYLPLTGGTVSGELKISQNTSAFLRIETTSDDTNAVLEFRNNNKPTGVIYRSEADGSDDKGKLYLRRYDANTNVATTSLVLTDDSIETNVPIYIVDHTDFNTAVTRGHLESRYLPLTSGTLTADLKIEVGTSAELTLDSTSSGSSIVRFQAAGDNTGYMLSNDSYNKITKITTSGAYSDLIMRDTYSEFNYPVHGIDSTDTDSFTTRGYVDSSFLPLDGGTLSNNLDITKNSSAYMRIETTTETDWSVLEFKNNANRSGLIYRNAADASDDQGELRIRRYDTNTGYVTSQLRFTSDAIISDTPIYTVDGTHDDCATTKGYVDDNFLNKETSSTQYIGGDVFLTPASGNATMRLKGADGNDSCLIRFLNDAQENAWINTNTGTMTLRVFPVQDVNGNTTTTNNEFSMKETYSLFNKDVRCADMGSDDDSLTTKSYTDSQYGQLDSANTWTATNTFSNMGITAISPYLTFNSDSGASAHLQFRTNSLRTALLYSGANSTILARYSNSNTSTSKITLTDNSITFNNQVYGTKVQLSGTLKANGWTVLNDAFSSDNSYIDTRKPLRYSGITASTLDDDELVPKSYVDALEARVAALESA